MNSKKCSYCNRIKSLDSYRKVRDKYLPRCQACENKRLRDWCKDKRVALLAAYGGKCVCCGEARQEFLAIDHINGGGRRHRNSLAATGKNYLSWLRQESYPAGFRLLCHNCNTSRGMYGYCPHEGIPEVPLVRQKDGSFLPEEQPLKESAEKIAEQHEEKTQRQADSAAKRRKREAEKMRQWRKENPDYKIKARADNRAYQRKRQEQALERYGDKCRCCGERLVELLRITPVGAAEKCPSGRMIAEWIRTKGYPDGYETLCLNCMKTHDRLGYCPHTPNLV